MNRRAGFTLIELLVVIAIIALLMAILMPALQRVKKQANAVTCQSNLHEWGRVFAMYTDDNSGYLMRGYAGRAAVATIDDTWVGALRPYYSEPQVRLCPTATKPMIEGGQGTFSAWGVFGAGEDRTWAGPRGEGDYGSYGMNELAYNPAPDVTTRAVDYWRTVHVSGGNKIPLLSDCIWFDAYPRDTDSPPAYDGDISASEMQRVCINRHQGHISCLFMDWSLRRVGLKELGTLKWHRRFMDEGRPCPALRLADMDERFQGLLGKRRPDPITVPPRLPGEDKSGRGLRLSILLLSQSQDSRATERRHESVAFSPSCSVVF